MAEHRFARLAASATLLALVGAPFIAVPAIAADDGVVELNLLYINDFHGRIDDHTVDFAGTVETLTADYPGSTLFLSGGDNIGTSSFASASAQDQPTIDVLNALGLRASAVGNHEFDQGYDDISGRVRDAADFPYLAANVTYQGAPAFDAYALFDIEGATVGVIGAVTQETPELVSKGGIDGVAFSDPVAAVNAVAAQLTDGEAANDEADVLIALYHEGSALGEPNGATIDSQLAAGGVFARIVDETSPAVDVIFTGHTHAEYAWEAAVPGVAGETRPVLQTGSYGANVGQVVLEVDTATGAVTATVNRNVPRLEDDDEELAAAYPAVAEVQAIVDVALEQAAVLGDIVIGAAAADITTAFLDGARDDRTSESTLGNFVADAMLSMMSSEEYGGAEIGVVNPGGLRADLYAGDITYAQANAVLPFLNNLGTTTLSGAQFKTVLEQQWQREDDVSEFGARYRHLGLSSNVTYTFDESRPIGERITSITVSGEPLDPARDYRIGSYTFLLQGGDNFTELANGTDTKDTGLIDRDAWIEYISANSPIAPNLTRRSVSVTGLPDGPVAPGQQLALRFDKLDLTSLGVPANTEISAVFAGAAGDPVTDPVTAPVTAGSASLVAEAPNGLEGSATLIVTTDVTGTTVTLPLAIAASGVPGGELAQRGVEPWFIGAAVVVVLLLGGTVLVRSRRRG